MTGRWKGWFLIGIAAVLWSTSGLFAKAPAFDLWPVEWRGALLAFWRAASAAIVLVFFVRKVSWSWKLIPGCIAFAAMNWTFLNALVYDEATLVIWLQYTAPVWVFLGGWCFFRERPAWRDWLLLGMAAVGVAIIVGPQLGVGTAKGLIMGLLAGLFFACVILSLRWMKELDAAWIIFLYHLITALVFAPSIWQSQTFPSGNQWIYLLMFGPVQMGIPYVLFALGVKRVPSHEASSISLLEPILVPVWVFVAWRNHLDYQAPAVSTVVGALLILLGLAIRYAKTNAQIPKNLEDS